MILSNSEMFDRIRLRDNPIDQQAGPYWDRLLEFSKARQLLEPDFEKRCAADFHACFWELYLPAAFNARGIVLKRRFSKKKGGPDFYFEDGGSKVWIEAVTCGEPSKANAYNPPSDDPDDFASGLAPEEKIMQRLASAITYKIGKFEQYRQLLGHQDRYVIALNGYRALNGYPHDSAPLGSPFIVRTLFGARDLVTSEGKTFYQGAATTKAGAPLAQFFRPENKHVSGLFYSATNCWETAIPAGQGCFFIQNPLAPELTAISSRFPTWRCTTDGRIQRPESSAL